MGLRWAGALSVPKSHPHSSPSLDENAEAIGPMTKKESDDYHPGHIYLEIPRKTYFYLFLGILGVILIRYLSFWLK